MASGTEEAKALLTKLATDLQNQQLSDEQRRQRLEQLKVLGRNPANATPIFTEKAIGTLAGYGLDLPPGPVSREAMRCLANAMLLNENARQIVLDLNYSAKVAERMKNDDRDDEFLATRILFFTTYTGNLDIPSLVSRHQLAATVTDNLARHVKRHQTHDQAGMTRELAHPMADMALQETLKLIPNLVYYDAEAASGLTGCISPLAQLLSVHPLPTPPLQPPITLMINALMNLELAPSQKIEDDSVRSDLFPPTNPSALTNRLVRLLDAATPAANLPQSDLEKSLGPLLTLLRKLYPIAPASVQSQLQSDLLPPPPSSSPESTARIQPLGKDDTLPSRLLRLSLSVGLLRDAIPALMYEMCGADSEVLVDRIGYGYAAGFLSNNGLEVPGSVGSSSTSAHVGSDTKGADEGAAHHVPINPITGQRRDMETLDEGPDMSDEEKEREAERLFVLFERLRATGVVDVQNPVTKAMQEGAFERTE